MLDGGAPGPHARLLLRGIYGFEPRQERLASDGGTRRRDDPAAAHCLAHGAGKVQWNDPFLLMRFGQVRRDETFQLFGLRAAEVRQASLWTGLSRVHQSGGHLPGRHRLRAHRGYEDQWATDAALMDIGTNSWNWVDRRSVQEMTPCLTSSSCTSFPACRPELA